MKFSEKPSGPSTRSRCRRLDNSDNTSDNEDNFHIESEHYGKLLSESQIDYIRNSGSLPIKKQQQKKEFPQEVDQSGEGQTEEDLPDEHRECATISEPSSSTNPKKRKGRRPQANTSKRTSLKSSAKKASTSKKKIKAQSPAPPASPIPPTTPPTSTHDNHITWDFFDETSVSVEQTCPLCEKDLSSSVLEMEDEYETFGVERMKLPCVAVLACGHAFHSECLESITPLDQRTDPACTFCLSRVI